eukprot:TRINITY_DN47544_c0_g1_i1.p1 TRINITY_DN47544_c0_g1~~TRINITY_DN47544_c0_g1_i1.p1  ORF type:complete len:887 (+),score=281.48 TRINITY_DN47544_c0_g1_i1:83-2662(+)
MSAPTDRLERALPEPIPGDGKEQLRLGFDGVAETAPNLHYPCGRWAELAPCAVLLTEYRLVILHHDGRRPNAAIPLLALESNPELKQADGKWSKDWGGGAAVWQVELVHKLPFTWTLVFRNAQRAEGQGLARLISTQRDQHMRELPCMFAFKHAKAYGEAYKDDGLVDGWTLYDVERELERQVGPASIPGAADESAGRGIGKNLRPWYRIAQLEPKGEEGSSPTYPNRFVVPIEATDKLIQAILPFRSRGRVPMVSYVHLPTGASLARASQPLNGLKGKRNDADEIMLVSLLPSAYKVGGTPIPACYSDFSGKGAAAAAAAVATGDAADRSPKVAAVVPGGARPPPLAGGGRPPPLATGRPPPLPTGRPPPLTGPPRQGSTGSAPPSAAAAGDAAGESPPSAALGVKEKERERGHIVIFDARSQAAARANAAGRGGGYEDVRSGYKGGRLYFLDMGNVHAVLASWEGIRKLVSAHNNNISTTNDRDLVPGNENTNCRFLKHWEKTDWVLHCQRLLWGACRIVDELLAGNSALVHCSDGWDRTAQLTSTAMLLIDPYYRTIKGFAVLVEKEFLAAGHKFAERSGHQVTGTMQRSPWAQKLAADDDDDEDDKGKREGIARHTRHGRHQEVAPIFCQWLDAVFQVVRQFPFSFEFTPAMLEYLAEAVYSGRFGTFLCNFDKEREGEGVKTGTVSVWTELLRLAQQERAGGGSGRLRLLNPLYRPAGRSRVLRPSPNGKRMAIWESLYLRYDAELSTCDKCPSEAVLNQCARWKEEALRLRQRLRLAAEQQEAEAEDSDQAGSGGEDGPPNAFESSFAGLRTESPTPPAGAKPCGDDAAGRGAARAKRRDPFNPCDSSDSEPG